MFGSLERSLESYRVEAFTLDYLLRGQLRPLGELPNYINDRRREFIRVEEAEIVPITGDRHLRPIHRETFIASKHNLLVLSLVEPGDAVKTQILISKRPVVLYLAQLIVRGQLHVTAEASEDDLIDDARDFYAVSEANVYHLHGATPAYAREVPLLFVNRPLVQGYHLHTE
jgi:hypothetical protein